MLGKCVWMCWGVCLVLHKACRQFSSCVQVSINLVEGNGSSPNIYIYFRYCSLHTASNGQEQINWLSILSKHKQNLVLETSVPHSICFHTSDKSESDKALDFAWILTIAPRVIRQAYRRPPWKITASSWEARTWRPSYSLIKVESFRTETATFRVWVRRWTSLWQFKPNYWYTLYL